MDRLILPRVGPWVAAFLLFIALSAVAADKAVAIRLPKHTKPTPVQQLNREGVKAIERHDYDKASKFFYRAYLLDPNDPFTLNNLGYASELQGDIERATRFYDLAQQQNSDAAIDIASSPDLQGKAVSKVAGNAAEMGMQINRINLAAISLLKKGRAPEADILLQQGLTLDPNNPFTLNNMGYAREKEGELDSALSFYTTAAALNSRDPIIVTLNRSWRGKPISSIAGENAGKLRKELARQQGSAELVARLNLQGVSAMNRNDREDARKDFAQAYQLDAGDAFTLNNMGYLAELDGDRETANFYYEKAQEARRHSAVVTAATRTEVEGKKVQQVADASDQAVAAQLKAQQELKQRQGVPIELKTRPKPPTSQPTDQPPSVSEPIGN
jgi:Flp pilus assembly protein TadD